MNAKLRQAVGEARDRLHGRLAARRAVLGAAVAAIPAAALAAGAWGGLSGWIAPAVVSVAAAAGAAIGAATRVTLGDAALALDRAVVADDRLASAWELDARGAASPMESCTIAEGVSRLRPASFPWSFRRRDALGALAASAFALLALAAPVGDVVTRARGNGAPRILSEEAARVARSASAAASAARDAGSPQAAAAAEAAAAFAQNMEKAEAGSAAAEAARQSAALRAEAARVRESNPEAAKALDRLADRLDATGARLAEAAGTAPGKGEGIAGDMGGGNAGVHGSTTSTNTPFVPAVTADPVALRNPTWAPDYDAAVAHYFGDATR